MRQGTETNPGETDYGSPSPREKPVLGEELAATRYDEMPTALVFHQG